MNVKKGFQSMLLPIIILSILAIVLVFLTYQKGGGAHITGLKTGAAMMIQVAPMMILAFIIAGTIPVLVPQDVVSRWVGAESGFRGILIGSVVGGFLPGGPFFTMPIAAGLMHVGAGTGTMVALITGWSLLAFNRMPLEIGIMGWKFVLIRLACTFFFPPIAGLLADRIFSGVKVI